MKLIRADYIFLVSLILLIGAHMTTNYLVWNMQDVAEKIKIAESVVLEYEAAPVARYFMGIERFKIIFSYVIAPAIWTGLYWLIRRKYSEQEVALEAYAIGMLMFCMLDFLNDASIALGMFL